MASAIRDPEQGVVAGLQYLHEHWENMVIHRDIKSSNVLLDSELNRQLGDYDIVRLYDHSVNPDTTLGYIAPELIQTEKATPSSDVFNFEVLLLEMACRTMPVDPSKSSELMILVVWVWELYTEGRCGRHQIQSRRRHMMWARWRKC